ncbi:MAG: LptA/OstA family protein [Negativicutes bacterium]|jgi:hypothetical protein
MFDTKKALFGLLALIMVFGSTMPSYAADKKAAEDNKKKSTSTKSDTAAKSQAPITIEGDELSFSDSTGQVFAKGNVLVTQNDVKLTSDLLNGNTKESIVWTDHEATITQPGVNLVGSGGLRFNYKDNTGNLKLATGKVGKQLVTGHNIEMVSANEIIINGGTMTMCPAKVPDYHVSASKIEIWPDDKLIAYGAKFWIKDKVIFSLPKYQKSLKKDAKSDMPRVGYSSDDGFYIKQYLEYPIVGNVAAFTDIALYSKAGFKPTYGVVNRERKYSLSVTHGEMEDDDDNWVKKEPEFKFEYYPHRLGNLPISYTFSAIYGKWTDDYKTSWHQDYNLYFSGDPIKLNDTMKLYLGTGFQKVLESYDDSARNVFRYDATLTKQFSSRLNTWVGYHYIKNHTGLFSYNNVDLGREFDAGFSYKIDRLNTISFNQSYDLDNHRVYDQDYTWYRDLHCWQSSLTYRAKREQFVWDVTVTRW